MAKPRILLICPVDSVHRGVCGRRDDRRRHFASLRCAHYECGEERVGWHSAERDHQPSAVYHSCAVRQIQRLRCRAKAVAEWT